VTLSYSKYIPIDQLVSEAKVTWPGIKVWNVLAKGPCPAQGTAITGPGGSLTLYKAKMLCIFESLETLS